MIKIDFTLNCRFLWPPAEGLSWKLCLSEFSVKGNLLLLFIKMIATPLKHPGIHLPSETSSQRRNVPMHAIFYDSIPSGTLTPVKELMKYQISSLKPNSHKKSQFVEIGLLTFACSWDSVSSLSMSLFSFFVQCSSFKISLMMKIFKLCSGN